MESSISRDRWLRPRAIFLCLIILVSGLVRLCLFQQFPALLTNDSWGYVAAAEKIYHDVDFFNLNLRDVRMPAYSTFLALTYPLTDMLSSRLVLLQKVLGMFSTFLGFVVGLKLRSWRVAGVLALFLGLNPVFLLFEHLIMPDALFIFLLLSLILLALWNAEGAFKWYKAVPLGAVAGTCVLTRASILLLCVVLTAGIVFIRFVRDRTSLTTVRSLRASAIFFVISILTTFLVIAPWLWRNQILFGNVSLVNFNSRNLLMYKAMHANLDFSLPLMEQVNKSLGVENLQYLDYGWLGKLSDVYATSEAERIARDLLWEQMANNPVGHVSDMLETFFSFGGMPPTSGNDRFALRFWFTYFVKDSAMVHRVNTSPPALQGPRDFVYVPIGSDPLLMHYWSLAGVWYLDIVYPTLFISFFLLLVLLFVYLRYNPTAAPTGSYAYVIWVCGSAYLATVLGHTLTLTDNDRYIASLGVLSFLVSVTIIAYFYRSWREVQAARETPGIDS